MMRFHRRSTTPLIAILASAGCGAEVVSANCTDQANPGIALTLEDSTTGARHPFTDVVAVASEGAFRDTARAAGYAPWTTSGVRVEEERVCHHVITRSLVAKLRPQAMP